MQAQREQVGAERVRLAQLAAGTPMYLEPGLDGRLVPRAWLAAWRDFVAGASKRAAGAGPAIPPPSLAKAMMEALCDCHEGAEQGVRFSPPAVAQKCVIAIGAASCQHVVQQSLPAQLLRTLPCCMPLSLILLGVHDAS